MEWEFTSHEEGDLEGAFLLVAVPVTRNVSPIISTALLREPDRRLVATVQSDWMPPVSKAHRGVVSGPMHIWALPGPAGLDGASREMLVLASDIRLTPDVLMGFCGALARWAKEKQVAFTLSVEGTDPKDLDDALHLATTHAGEGLLDDLGIALHDGVHAGFNAALLARFNQYKLPAAGILAATPGDVESDADAAVRAIHAIAPLLPHDLSGDGVDEAARELSRLIERTRAAHVAARRDLDAAADHDPGYA